MAKTLPSPCVSTDSRLRRCLCLAALRMQARQAAEPGPLAKAAASLLPPGETRHCLLVCYTSSPCLARSPEHPSWGPVNCASKISVLALPLPFYQRLTPFPAAAAAAAAAIAAHELSANAGLAGPRAGGLPVLPSLCFLLSMVLSMLLSAPCSSLHVSLHASLCSLFSMLLYSLLSAPSLHASLCSLFSMLLYSLFSAPSLHASLCSLFYSLFAPLSSLSTSAPPSLPSPPSALPCRQAALALLMSGCGLPRRAREISGGKTLAAGAGAEAAAGAGAGARRRGRRRYRP